MRPERIISLDELAYFVKKYFGWVKKSVLINVNSPVEIMLLIFMDNLIKHKLSGGKGYRDILREAIYRNAIYFLFKTKT